MQPRAVRSFGQCVAAVAAFLVLPALAFTSPSATGVSGDSSSESGLKGTRFEVALVADLNPGQASSRPDVLTAAHGQLHFSATSPGVGREPWVTDGTAAGTRLVGDFVPGPRSSELRYVTSIGSATILALDNRGAVPEGPRPARYGRPRRPLRARGQPRC